MWTDAYIGLPFQPGGRGPAYDCLGLFLRLQRDRRGLVLPDPLCAMQGAALSPAVIAARRDWRVATDPQEGDAAVFVVPPHGFHVGYVINARDMLHIEGGEGAAIEEIFANRRKHRFKEFLRYV